jgi:cysteine desulfurase
MGYDPAEAASGLRISLGPWVTHEALGSFPDALAEACAELATATAF